MRGHQPAADLILAHDLKQLAVKHAELRRLFTRSLEKRNREKVFNKSYL